MRNGRLPTGLFSASMVLYYRNCRRGPGVVLNGRKEGRGRETGTAYVHGHDHCPARRKGVKLETDDASCQKSREVIRRSYWPYSIKSLSDISENRTKKKAVKFPKKGFWYS